MFLQELPDQADHVRLLDFGMVKFLEGSSSRTVPENLTRAGVVFGTPAYMSPEQVKGGPADARTDVYAAGVLLFELLAGRRPFVADTYEGYIGAHLTQPVPSLAKVRPGLAAARLFQAVVERAMAKKPAARFKDAGAMLAALEAVIAKLPAAAASGGRAEARRKPTPARAARRRRARVSGAAPSWWSRSRRESRPSAMYLRRDGATPVETAALPAEPPPKAAPPAAPPPKPPQPRAAAQAAADAGAAAAAAQSEPPAPQPPKPRRRAAAAGDSRRRKRRRRTKGSRSRRSSRKTERQPRSRARNPWRGACSPRPPADPRPGRSRRAHVPAGASPGVRIRARAIRATRVPGFCSDAPTRSSIGSATPWTGTSGPTTSIRPVGATRRCSRICSRPPRIRPPGRAAARAIRDIYGAEAIPALEKAMKRRAGDREATARLAQLRESLPH